MNIVKSVIVFTMMFLVSFAAQTNESPRDYPLYGYEHLSESHVIQSVVELYPNISPEEARKVVSLVNYYASDMDINPVIALAMIGTESSFRKYAKSPTGAGYTQVYPKYHKDKIKNRDIFKTQVNIEVGLTVLSNCKKKRNGNYISALACYNGAVSKDKAQTYNSKIRKQKSRLMTKVYEIVMAG